MRNPHSFADWAHTSIRPKWNLLTFMCGIIIWKLFERNLSELKFFRYLRDHLKKKMLSIQWKSMISIIIHQILFCVLNNKNFTTLHLKIWINYNIPVNQLTGITFYIQALILLYSSGLKQTMSINQTFWNWKFCACINKSM